MRLDPEPPSRLNFSLLPAGKARGHSGKSAEVASEVTLVGEPNCLSYLGQRQLSVTKQSLDVFKAPLEQIPVRGNSNRLPESACKMVRRKACHGR